MDETLLGWIELAAIRQQSAEGVHIVSEPCGLVETSSGDGFDERTNEGLGSQVDQQRREAFSILNRRRLADYLCEAVNELGVDIDDEALKESKSAVALRL